MSRSRVIGAGVTDNNYETDLSKPRNQEIIKTEGVGGAILGIKAKTAVRESDTSAF